MDVPVNDLVVDVVDAGEWMGSTRVGSPLMGRSQVSVTTFSPSGSAVSIPTEIVSEQTPSLANLGEGGSSNFPVGDIDGYWVLLLPEVD